MPNSLGTAVRVEVGLQLRFGYAVKSTHEAAEIAPGYVDVLARDGDQDVGPRLCRRSIQPRSQPGNRACAEGLPGPVFLRTHGG